MKKIFSLILIIAFVYSCSTNTDENRPLPPSNLTGAVASSTQINLSWTDNSNDETGFKIERKTGAGNYSIVGTTINDVNTFNDIGLTPNITYTYRVFSFNSSGNSTSSNELNVTLLPNTDIGTQNWTTTNLDVTAYRDGTPIPQVTEPTQWAALTTGAWCYYNNSSANGTTYGKLYNWYAVFGIHDTDPNTPNKILAPNGYHIASDGEVNLFSNYLGGVAISGGKMKSTGTTLWTSPNTGASNISGFTGLPGGYRNYDGAFFGIGNNGYWWSSTQFGASTAGFWRLNYNDRELGRYNSGNVKTGFSVRLIRD